jgi:hypothetical protein
MVGESHKNLSRHSSLKPVVSSKNEGIALLNQNGSLNTLQFSFIRKVFGIEIEVSVFQFVKRALFL